MREAARIAILAGTGPLYGTGHETRMGELCRLLEEQGIPALLLVTREERILSPRSLLPAGVEPHSLLWVLDVRDMDPRPFLEGRRVLALDNRWEGRERSTEDDRLLFYDTIPHPESEEWENTLRQALIRPGRREEARSTRKREILLYTGEFAGAPSLDHFLLPLLEEGVVERITRCGTTPPSLNKSGFFHYPRLDADRFYAAMDSATWVIAYFGITLLEAWSGGAVPVVFDNGNPVHDPLRLDLVRRTGMAHLVRRDGIWQISPPGLFAEELPLEKMRPSRMSPPAGEGFSLLVETLRSLSG